jgi:DNA repair ATPase RecN
VKAPEIADAALTLALREQIALYRQVREALAVVAEQVRQGQEAREALDRIADSLKEACSVADRITAAREQLHAASAKPGAESNALLREATALLGEVKTSLNALSQSAQAKQRAVAEELDTLNQADKMRQAYGAPPEGPT